jgi:prolyl oligopeptidase
MGHCKTISAATVAAAFLLISLLLAGQSRAQWKYPPTRTVDVSDAYFGKTYADPYRWLEDTKDKEVEDWFKAQAIVTDNVLDKIPARDALAREWMELDKLRAASYSSNVVENGRVFYKKTLGGENVGKLYYRQGWNGEEQLLFDPASYKVGVATVIQSFLPSWDGEHVVLGLTASGTEWSELRILNVSRQTLLPDSIYPSRLPPFSWTPDSQSFLYDGGNVTDIKSLDIHLNRKARLHKIGTPVQADIDIFSNESHPELEIAPKEFPIAYLDESYPRYVFGAAAKAGAELRLFYAPISGLRDSGIKWNELCRSSDNIVRGFEPYGGYLYAITHTGAPKRKVVRTRLEQPDWEHAEVVVPEAKDSIISLAKSKSYLFVVYSDGINDRILKCDFATGKHSDVKLPGAGAVEIHCPDWRANLCHVIITSWTRPSTRYDYDAERETFQKSKFHADANYPGLGDVVAEEVDVPGHDGVMIPLSIIYRKGIPRDGSNSCILSGYGAYGFSATPSLDLTRHSLALHGVVMAVAHPRGGGEKGEAWYNAGKKTTKPNTWKDFISCAEYLVKRGYTSPAKLAGTGRSAGGILISRAVTERPDLFRAAICEVGWANALRLEAFGIGPANTPEFGTVADPTECAALYEMDGVQHVRKGVKYPAVMGVAGWNDPRIPVWQPGKFVAAMQNATTSGHPVLLKVNYDSGHLTEEKTVTFKNRAGQAAFLLWQTGRKEFQPVK